MSGSDFGQVCQVSHDAFARETVVRQTIRTRETCTWCGSNPHGRLFRYGVQPDSYDARTSWDSKLFCSIGCRRIYYSP